MAMQTVNISDTPNAGRIKWNANDQELDTRVSAIEGSGIAPPDNITLEVSGGVLSIKVQGVDTAQYKNESITLAKLAADVQNQLADSISYADEVTLQKIAGVFSLKDGGILLSHLSAALVDYIKTNPNADGVSLQNTAGVLAIKVGGVALSHIAGDLQNYILNNPAPDNVTIEKNVGGQLQLKAGGVFLGNLADEVISYIDTSGGSGGYEPDDLTINLNGSSQLQVKPASIDTAQCAPGLLALISASDSFINVLDYGADPTGVASSSQAFDDAFDAADAANRTIVYIPKGTYLVKNVRIHPNTTVLAEGATIAFGGANPDAPDPYELINATFHIWGADANNRCANVRFQGGTLVGNRASGNYTEQVDGDIINTAFTENVVFVFTKFQDAARHAIEAKRAEKLTFDYCDFRDIAGSVLNPTGCRGITLSNSTGGDFRRIGEAKTSTIDCSGFNIFNCRFDIAFTGILFYDVKDISIYNNSFAYKINTDISAFFDDIIYLRGDFSHTPVTPVFENINIYGNRLINRTGQNGGGFRALSIRNTDYRNINIFANSCFGAIIRFSDVSGPDTASHNVYIGSNTIDLLGAGNGIAISGGGIINVKVSENLIFNTSASGIYIDNSGYPAQRVFIDNNQIDNCGIGIYFSAANKNVARANAISNCTTGVELTADADNCVLTDTVFDSCTVNVVDAGTGNTETDTITL